MTVIHIRHAEAADAQAIHNIYTARGVVEWTLQLPYQSVKEWESRLEGKNEGVWHLVACDGGSEGDVVGSIGVVTSPNRPRKRDAGQIGMGVRPDWQGRGVGKRLMAAMLDLADNWLNLRRLELEVYPDNKRAIGLYLAHGFVEEGRVRESTFRNGEYIDSLIMGRLRPR